MCEEDSEDHEAVAKLFEINDSIHRTVERYKLFKKGDIEGANQIPQGTLGRSGAGVSQGPNNTLNLIDFGDPEPAPSTSQPQSSGAPQQSAPVGNALEDDLLGLSLGSDSYGQSGSISLGGSNGSGECYNTVLLHHTLTLSQFLDCLVWLCLRLNRRRPLLNKLTTCSRPRRIRHHNKSLHLRRRLLHNPRYHRLAHRTPSQLLPRRLASLLHSNISNPSSSHQHPLPW
jgi:hypothetical protein